MKTCVWEGRPAIWEPGEAWSIIKDAWSRVDDADVGMSARLVSVEEFKKLFPDLPELPKAAFQSSDKPAAAAEPGAVSL